MALSDNNNNNNNIIPNLLHPAGSNTSVPTTTKAYSPKKTNNKDTKCWYENRLQPSSSSTPPSSSSSFSSDLEDMNTRDDPSNMTPSPKKRMDQEGQQTSNDHKFQYASTPLHPNSNISFISPIRRLNDLHLDSPLASEDILINEIEDHEESLHDDDDDEDEEEGLANQTINTDDIDPDEQDGEDGIIYESSPQYINTRKRIHIESPTMIITPNSNDSKMTICTTSGTTNNLKFSFSPSDATPCPPQPRRKKLKFKDNTGGPEDSSNLQKNKSQGYFKRPILDLANSIKTPIDEIMYQPVKQEDGDEDDEEEILNDEEFGLNQGTPISQSTPANSRAPSPASKRNQPRQQPTQSEKYEEYEEYGEEINGYKFIKPTTSASQQQQQSQFKYETPVNNNKYTKLREEYNRNEFEPTTSTSQKYQILGEIPITSAGMMDEDEEEIHIGDKRINDPYLHMPDSTSNRTQRQSTNKLLRQSYFQGIRIPLLPPHYYQQANLPHETILTLITPQKLRQFYEMIKLPEEELVEILRVERIKWHPDKWVGRLKQQNDLEVGHLNLEIVDCLSRNINGLLESMI
ncbi:uncharacterized protein J8A68_002718 [[Candida] subhashii]|uniref:Uncharacterized protein n=1 Tax=[Candida] subhashii TaxID=561895 RepID=A0A8J5QWW9_9ASCO|nr:uncharacterized protein J8A68_002718 [[Candida] subhashii]KAG7663745.1 hypothetical protein J8A68_002718 [[Candida] subhashii]